MLDFRLKTLLAVCNEGSYTKAAEVLHITQPAVTQHIRYLEKHYGTKLFVYKDRSMQLTYDGERLKNYVATMEAGIKKIELLMTSEKGSCEPIAFGATLTIGEYAMPFIIARLLKKNPRLHLTMEVKNTEVLLEMLEKGNIEFAFLEGYFDRSRYDSLLFSKEDFIAVCAPENPLAKSPVTLETLFSERLILREKGSGSRDILEQVLHEHNHNVKEFSSILELGTIRGIKQMVHDNLGITFVYRKAVKKELEEGSLKEINIIDVNISREFNFVYLKNDIHEEEHRNWFLRFYEEKEKLVL